MKKLIVTIFLVFSFLLSNAQEKKLTLVGYIYESIGKTPLMNAYAVPIDADGNPGDTIPAGTLEMHNGKPLIRTDRPVYVFTTVHEDSTYVFEIGCEGYMTQTVVYRAENLGKRESRREMPPVYLERAPRKLGEVTVTASKVKFYNRGDTLVYNADAFQLAEGSMLDGLISQLPGVELNSDGQIKVNGEFVESLLLNGREFFDGNNNLMLKNLAAYTVKNVEVYRGESFVDKWLGNTAAPKKLTMDVKLKKEYMMGWILNAQGGYGTDNRYIGRLFAGWFNSTTNVMLLGNINNLNDTREPGKSDRWTPDKMPSGTMKYQMLGLGYNYQSNDRSKYAMGNVTFDKNWLDSRTYTDRTNFYTARNTYDYSSVRNNFKNVSLRTSHSGGTSVGKNVKMNGELKGNYLRSDRSSRSLSASYYDEQSGMTMRALEAIYSDGSDTNLADVINRSITRTDGESKEGSVDGNVGLSYYVPQSNDRIFLNLKAKYLNKKETLWDDYDVRFGLDGLAPVRRRNYTDNSPNHDLNLSGSLGYDGQSGDIRFSLKYAYDILMRDRDSYMYALDRLADMGVYGTLPAGYLSAFDAPNSYRSSLIENTHTVVPSLSGSTGKKSWGLLDFSFTPELGVRHSHFNYFSDGASYPVRRSSFIGTVANLGGHLRYAKGERVKGENMYVVTYDYSLETETPDLLYMTDVVNTSDPLNIMLGNPGLKNAYHHKHDFSVRFFAAHKFLNDYVGVIYAPVTNALVRGYTYDSATGIRHLRSYNVRGNYSVELSNTFNLLQFGSKRQFSLTSISRIGRIHSVDMIGLNVDEPLRSTVNTRNLSEDIKFSWTIGKQSLTFNGNVINRRTTSSRDDFADISATHLNYGVLGTFSLPAGFGISTDFTFYTRSGYGVKELDTTDAVWNMRATYTPRGGRWVFMVDGFDLLHRLSNVHYAVNASGRTVTYTNTLPRYVLFSVQYRLNIMPKKK